MQKILVIQNKRIGDVLLASVIAQNMKQVYPDSLIDFLVYDYTVGVIENNPNISEIIVVNDKKLKKIHNLFKLIIKIRKRRYDIIFDPYAKLQSRAICRFSGAKMRIGYQKEHEKKTTPFYTHSVQFLKEKSHICGKAIQDRINLVTSFFSVPSIDYEPKIHLTTEEQEYNKLNAYSKPVLMLGVLGSTPQKSMPYNYVIEIVNFITSNYDVYVLFNYAPHQKNDALEIYNQCENKEKIIVDIYEDSIRGFITLMNKCVLLVANEGGTVHISKALNKPTFTIFSPYVLKEHWASFEDGIMHTSIHLLDEKPQFFNTSKEDRRRIENDPNYFYLQLTPQLIIPKLKVFLNNYLILDNEIIR
jgi:heptosyltransferase-2